MKLTMEIKPGAKIIAKDNFFMKGGIDEGKLFLIKGKEYKVLKALDTIFTIESEIDDSHIFGRFEFHEFFTYKTDKIVDQVIEKYKSRSQVGINKYGTTLEENNHDNFLLHLQQEMQDATLYIEKLMSKPNYENIQPQVVKWFYDKGLINKDNSTKQLCKVIEEIGELSGAILKENKEEELDSFGDVLITLIGLAEMRKVNLLECLEMAFNVIKDRKGVVKDGTFIREKDELSN